MTLDLDPLLPPLLWDAGLPLTLHKQVEAQGVPAEQPDGSLCHGHQGGVLLRVPLDVIFHV